jgi:hypothetical protein
MLRLRAGISAAAALWRNSGQDNSRLISGALLKDAVKLMATNAQTLTPDEKRFIDASVVEARREWRRRAKNYGVAAAIVLLAIFIATIGPQQVSYGVSFARALPTVWSDGGQIPLSAEAKANFKKSIDALGGYLSGQGADMGRRPELNAWAIAEIWLALHGLDPAVANGGPRLREFMTANRDSVCQCWRETPDKLPHTLVTAWVLYALAHYDQPATADEIAAVLKRQGDTGWWAMFPATRSESNASTSATTWTLLALHHHYEKSLIPPDQRPAVAEAIRKTVDWLTRRAIAGQARWTEYPPDETFEKRLEYLAASALVVHALHTVAKSNDFDTLWLDQLPQRVPPPLENEVAKGYVRGETYFTLDDSRHYIFPWMLRATVEAYAHGNAMQRARALLWLEEAFKTPLRPEDFRSEFWTMAETLFALRHVQGLTAPGGGAPAISSEPEAAEVPTSAVRR